MDENSIPVKVEKLQLSTLFYLKPRTRHAGRELVIGYDERFPLQPGFKNRYSYVVRFKEAGNTAGNHYHKDKAEIMLPLAGEFEIKAEDITTKQREQFLINAADNIAFYVPAGISHSIKCLTKSGLLLVTASTAGQESDTFRYVIE